MMAEATRGRGYQYFGVAKRRQRLNLTGICYAVAIGIVPQGEIGQFLAGQCRAVAVVIQCGQWRVPVASEHPERDVAEQLPAAGDVALALRVVDQPRCLGSDPTPFATYPLPFTSNFTRASGTSRSVAVSPSANGSAMGVTKYGSFPKVAVRPFSVSILCLAARSGLALAPPRPRARLHDEHQSRRTFQDELDLTHWGVEIARKGGVPAERVLNALPLPDLLQHLKRRKHVQDGAAEEGGHRHAKRAAKVTAKAYTYGLIIERAGPEDEVIKCRH